MNRSTLNKAVELRHELHAHPELSGQEVWTKKRLEWLEDNDNKVEAEPNTDDRRSQVAHSKVR